MPVSERTYETFDYLVVTLVRDVIRTHTGPVDGEWLIEVECTRDTDERGRVISDPKIHHVLARRARTTVTYFPADAQITVTHNDERVVVNRTHLEANDNQVVFSKRDTPGGPS